jgi:hypothetical protein
MATYFLPFPVDPFILKISKRWNCSPRQKPTSLLLPLTSMTMATPRPSKVALQSSVRHTWREATITINTESTPQHHTTTPPLLNAKGHLPSQPRVIHHSAFPRTPRLRLETTTHMAKCLRPATCLRAWPHASPQGHDPAAVRAAPGSSPPFDQLTFYKWRTKLPMSPTRFLQSHADSVLCGAAVDNDNTVILPCISPVGVPLCRCTGNHWYAQQHRYSGHSGDGRI